MKRYATPVLIALMLALSGCEDLDWEKETIVVTMAPEKDEIRAFYVYEGLHVEGSSERDLDRAKTSLKERFDSKRKFCIFFHLWCIDHTRREAGEQGTDRSDSLATLIRNHIAIRSGFFLNPEGRLSGWQQVTIRNLGSFVEARNGLISESFSEMAAKELQAKLDPNRKSTDETWDDLTLELLQRAARDQHQWIRVEPGRASFTMFGSPEFFAKHSPELEKLKTDSLYNWSVDQRSDRVTIALSYGDGEPIRVVLKGASQEKRNREDELSKFARSLPVPFREQTSVESVIAEFLASVDR